MKLTEWIEQTPDNASPWVILAQALIKGRTSASGEREIGLITGVAMMLCLMDAYGVPDDLREYVETFERDEWELPK